MGMQASWEELEQAIRCCERCGLCRGRQNAVPGEGDRNAGVMLIGEGPGQVEDETGRPFVGPAGQLLDRMLAAIGHRREEVYIANVVKCRPPRNRDPLGEEQNACRHWLDGQLALVRPKIVVCLGRIAAAAYIKPDFKITREHGVWFDVDGVRAMAIYHPSALLRDVSKRPETFTDLRELRRTARELCQHLYS